MSAPGAVYRATPRGGTEPRWERPGAGSASPSKP